MLNQIILVGRLTKDLEVKEEEGKKVCSITLAIPRSFKNENGIYDTDFVKCILWNSIAENTAEYCRKGDMVGVKGRIESDANQCISIIAEKITFLSSKPKTEEED